MDKIYLLKHDGDEGFVVAIDGAVDVYMAFFDKEDAVSEAARQNEMYDIECYAVEVGISSQPAPVSND